MNIKPLLFNLILVGMNLGTAWAVRGQFGHEQGAAWAGSIAALCILLLARREDWHGKLFKATLAAAVGWGIGGMMSYGMVVGYGQGTDFSKVYYGFLMLFVIGGLYGFMGGGLFGLVLESSDEHKLDWSILACKMVAGAIIVYGLLVYQLGWLMTPPRSELWAACLGMALALSWHFVQHKYPAALRIALFAGLGAGFGFAFGNFLQVLGKASEISFNFWNVMEYSLGFFGGIGMAYGTFTADLPQKTSSQTAQQHLIPLLLLVLFIPFVIWNQSFEWEKLSKIYGSFSGGAMSGFAMVIRWLALALVAIYTIISVYKYYFKHQQLGRSYQEQDTHLFFLMSFGFYILLSLLITGALFSSYRIEQYLYLINFLLILYGIGISKPSFSLQKTELKSCLAFFLFAFGILALLAFVVVF